MYLWLKKRKFFIFRTTIKHENDSIIIIHLVIKTILLKLKDMQRKKHFLLDYYIYMINITTSGQHILKTYKHRWGIESGCHVAQKFQGRTTSKNVVFRVLLKGLGFILTAVWIRLNVRMKILLLVKESKQVENITDPKFLFGFNV